MTVPRSFSYPTLRPAQPGRRLHQVGSERLLGSVPKIHRMSPEACKSVREAEQVRCFRRVRPVAASRGLCDSPRGDVLTRGMLIALPIILSFRGHQNGQVGVVTSWVCICMPNYRCARQHVSPGGLSE